MSRDGLEGYLGGDPELWEDPDDGTLVARFSLAVNGYQKDHVYWFIVFCFGKLAKAVCEHCRKGARVEVSNSPQSRSFQDNEGRTQSVLEIITCFVRVVKAEHTYEQISQGEPSIFKKLLEEPPPFVLPPEFIQLGESIMMPGDMPGDPEV